MLDNRNADLEGPPGVQGGAHGRKQLRPQLLRAVVRQQDLPGGGVYTGGRNACDHEGSSGGRGPWTRHFHLFTHNLRCKPFRGMAHILMLWDETERWDALCFQEVFGDDGKSGDNAPRIMQDMGQGRHVLVLGPPRQGGGGGGRLRVAAEVHHRWARYLSATACATRSVSVLL